MSVTKMAFPIAVELGPVLRAAIAKSKMNRAKFGRSDPRGLSPPFRDELVDRHATPYFGAGILGEAIAVLHPRV